MNGKPITDEEITAFLDDALPPEEQARIAMAAAERPDVAQRIEALSIDTSGLSQGFDALLAHAPALEIPDPAPLAMPQPANQRRAPSARWQAVAAAALLAVGVGLGWALGTQHSAPSGAHGWHVAVAEYQALYATETLTGTALTEAQRWGSLATTASAVGLDLADGNVTLDGLDFRRAQLLRVEGKPLAQLAFLDANGTAIALCFTRMDGADEALREMTLSGLASVTWQRGGMAFILIGGEDTGTLKTWQEQFDRGLST